MRRPANAMQCNEARPSIRCIKSQTITFGGKKGKCKQ